MSYQALSLNGSGYASIAHTSQAGLDMGLSDFMIEARIKTTSSGGYTQFVSKRLSSGTYNGWYLGKWTDDALVILFTKDVANNYALSTATINDGRWHYVVGVADRSSATGLKLFIGGSEVTYSHQNDVTGLGSVATSALFQISGHDGATGLFTGRVDSVRIWNFGKDGLPADFATYIAWRATGRNVFKDISEYNSGSWNGYADADRSELTTNGDMEADSTWAARGSPTTEEQSTDQKNGGSNSWKIISDAAGQGAYQDITTVVGEYYKVTGYAYVTAGDAKLGKEDTDGSDQVLTGQATAAAWTEFNVVFLATETTSRIFFQADATDASTFYIDDVSVKRTGLTARYKFSGDYTDETTNSNDLTAGGTGNTFPGYSLRHPMQKMLLGV